MELCRTSDGLVTPLAIARAIRGVAASRLGLLVGVDVDQIARWEQADDVPTAAQVKRISLVLRWPVPQLTADPMPYERAFDHVVAARKQTAKHRHTV